MRSLGIVLGCLVVVFVASLARAEIIPYEVASLHHVVGQPLSSASRFNIASITNPSTGIYRITLSSGCGNVAPYGVARVQVKRGDGSCFGEFTNSTTIDVSCFTTANTLTNIPNGTKIVLSAQCARP